MLMDGGAPRSAWKATFQGPSTARSCVSAGFGIVCDVSFVGLRNTTNTVPHGSRCSGTVVRPPATEYEAEAVLPVSEYHNSGALPAKRKVASNAESLSPRLSRK